MHSKGTEIYEKIENREMLMKGQGILMKPGETYIVFCRSGVVVVVVLVVGQSSRAELVPVP